MLVIDSLRLLLQNADFRYDDMMFQSVIIIIINVSLLLVLTDKDPTLRIESFAIVTKSRFDSKFT